MTPTREQLASIEWSLYVDTQRRCPACSAPRREGIHKSDCWLAACLAAPPSEPQAMPPIEIGDWVQDAAGEIRRVMDSDHISWLNVNRTIYEIRKASGTVWTREPRR